MPGCHTRVPPYMSLTKCGVAYDLEISPYRVMVEGYTYVFSSRMHLNKFKDKLNANRERINKSLTVRFNFPVAINVLCDVTLYERIESRGFLILTETGEKLWQNQYQLNGAKLMPRTYSELLRTSTQNEQC